MCTACHTLGWKSTAIMTPWSLVILAYPTHDIVTMTLHTRPSGFSASNIDKPGSLEMMLISLVWLLC